MLFSSIFFIFFFLPLLLGIYFLVPNKFRNIILLIFSIVFYSWGEPIYVLLMLFSSTFNFTMAKSMEEERGTKAMKLTFIFTLVVNLFILSFFKYYGFFMDTVNSILGTDIKYTALALPIGISFYTFQALSYIIDVYWGKVKVQNSWLNFTLYLSLFPQLIAGPIVQYKDVEAQLNNRTITWESFGEGSERFILGLGKKVIIANNMGAIYNSVIALSDDQSVLSLWMGILAFTLQIYFDFSGYSDMAIGLGKIFGFTFMENFNYPYISKSITEFWRRWHISLSSWFKDYLYLPLGGNRVKISRHILNLLIVWSLTGLWHGASWNFIAWGLFYGILLILEKYIWGKKLEEKPNWLKHIYTMIFVQLGWVFFSSENLILALKYIKGMFFLDGLDIINNQSLYILRTSFIFFAIGIACSTPIIKEQFATLSEKSKFMAVFLVMLIFIISTGYLVYSSYNPFLYFRF